MRNLWNKITHIGIIRQYTGLPKEVYLLVCSKMICACGYFVYCYCTLYLSQVMGMDSATIGRYMFLFAIAYIPGVFIGGKCSDLFSRKTTYLVYMLATDLFFILTGLFNGKPILVLFLGLGYFFDYALTPLYNSMMIDFTTPENRQEAYSLSTLMLNVGFSVMPIFGGLFFNRHPNWIFYGQGIMNLVAVFMILFLMKKSPRTAPEPNVQSELPSSNKKADSAKNVGLFRMLRQYPVVIFFALGGGLLYFIYSLYMYMIPLHMNELFGEAAGLSHYSTLCTINGLAIIFLTPLLIYITKKNSPILNMGITALMFMVGLGAYAFIGKPVPYIAMALIWSCGETMYFANTGVFVANVAPETHGARFQSFVDMVSVVGKSMGPMILGAYLMGHSFRQAWFVVIAISAMTAVYFCILHIRNQKPSDRAEGQVWRH